MMGGRTARGSRSEAAGEGGGLHLVVTAMSVILVAAGAIRFGMQSRSFVAQHPMNLVWIGGSLVAGLLVFGANGARVGLRAVAPWFGYGVLAAYLGFAMQGGVNGALLRGLGSSPDVWGYAALGVGAAACQTFAKWLALRFLGRVGVVTSPFRAVATGLAVGLGFGLAEVVILGENQIARQAGILVFPWLGIWERAAAVGFHAFSGAVLAIAIYEERWMPVLVVVALHALDDTVAGLVSARVVRVSAVYTCVFFSFVTGLLWTYSQTLRRSMLAGTPAEGAS